MAKIAFPWVKTAIRNGKIKEDIETMKEITNEKYKIYLLQDETIKELYQRRLEQKLEEFRFANLEKTYIHIKNSIKQAASEALGKIENRNQRYLGMKTYKIIEKKPGS